MSIWGEAPNGGIDIAGSLSSVLSFNARTGAVTLLSGDVTAALGFTPLDAVPVASGAILGGIKVGTGLAIDGAGVLSASGSAGVASFNTRTGVVSLLNADVTGALGYVPTPNTQIAAAGTLGLIKVGSGLSIDGSGVLSASGTAGVSSFNSRTGAVTLLSSDVTSALGYTPYNGAANPSGYLTSSTLPIASASVLGGIKVGTGLTINGSGVLSASGGANNEVNVVTDYGAVADFILGAAGTKVSGTGQDTAFTNAANSGRPIYVPAGTYEIDSYPTLSLLQHSTWYGPGLIYSNVGSNGGWRPVGKSLVIGSSSNQGQTYSFGGVLLGGENGSKDGNYLFPSAHNWTQFQPTRQGAPCLIQLYSSGISGTAYASTSNTLVANYGQFTWGNTQSDIRVNDYIGWRSRFFIVSAVTNSTHITVKNVDGSVADLTKDIYGTTGAVPLGTEGAFSCPWESALATANISSSGLITYATGDTWPSGGSDNYMYVDISGSGVGNGTYTVTSGPETAGVNYLQISGWASGTLTGKTVFFKRTHVNTAYQSAFRLQGVAGGRETNAVFFYSAASDLVIANASTNRTYSGMISLEANTINIGVGNYWSLDAAWMANFVTIGNKTSPTVKVIDWGFNNHFTLYGGTTGQAITLACEGSDSSIPFSLRTKGGGMLYIDSKNDAGTYGLYPIVNTTLNTVTNKIPVNVNGTTYYLLASTSGA